jgi:hypothetical protein
MNRSSITASVLRFLLAGWLAGCSDGATAPKTGMISLDITGLPADVPASVSISGPGGGTLTATASRTFESLPPGRYTVTAANAVTTRNTFSPVSVTTAVDVVAGDTPAQASVTYAVATAVASITISGVPANQTPAVTLSNGIGYSRTISASGEMGNLPPGNYSVSAVNIDVDEIYAGTPTPPSVDLTPSTTAVEISVVYGPITGAIQLSSEGLPSGVMATWDVSGPGGLLRTARSSGAIAVSHLPSGQYTVTARNLVFQGQTYGSSSGPSVVTVVAGTTVSTTTSFIPRPPSINLTIEGAYITQAIQSFGGLVPLVAGREGYLRVFVRANEPNEAAPSVRLRLYQNGQLVLTQAIAPPRDSVAMTVSEATTLDSWGTAIEGSLIQPGMSFLVDVDPDEIVPEVSESDNQFPVNGSPRAPEVRNAAPVNLLFVPILMADGSIGNMPAGRLAEMVNITSRMHPVSEVSAQLRIPYTTTLKLVPRDSNNAWVVVLGEIDVLRTAEGTGRQYVGVLHDNANTGIAGIGYVPGQSVVTIDEPYATEVLAHELGHNWGRFHSPCGGPSGVDLQYPYAGGIIGVYGYDIATGKVLSPDMPDVMSYCSLGIPFNIAIPRRWASDYTYTNVFNHRSAFGDQSAADNVEQDCLIVWGRITKTGLVLEPAFVSRTIPSLPARSGQFNLKALDGDGRSLLSLSFDPMPVEDAPEAESHFTFAIPVSQLPMSRVAALTLAGGGFAPSVQSARPESGVGRQVRMTSPRAGHVRLEWDPKETPLLVVRDPVTRQILSLARNGDVTVRTSRAQVAVTASNGVQSVDVQLR